MKCDNCTKYNDGEHCKFESQKNRRAREEDKHETDETCICQP